VPEPPGELEAALAAELDVQERDVRVELLGASERLRAGRRDPDHGNSLPLQKGAGRLQEVGAVIDDEAARSHAARIAGAMP
jgi:hypothetical protein